MRYIALVGFCCLISGKDSGSRDIQAIEVTAKSIPEVVRKISKMPISKYKNTEGKMVRWQLVDIFHVGMVSSRPKDMEELTGFIVGKSELFGKVSLVKPGLRYLMKPHRDSTKKRT